MIGIHTYTSYPHQTHNNHHHNHRNNHPYSNPFLSNPNNPLHSDFLGLGHLLLVSIGLGDVTREVLLAVLPAERIVHIGHGVGLRARVSCCERLCIGGSEVLSAIPTHCIQQAVILVVAVAAVIVVAMRFGRRNRNLD